MKEVINEIVLRDLISQISQILSTKEYSQIEDIEKRVRSIGETAIKFLQASQVLYKTESSLDPYYTVSQIAAHSGDVRVLEFLKNIGIDLLLPPKGAYPEHMLSPFHIAIQEGNVEAVKFFLKQCKANPTDKDQQQSPLYRSLFSLKRMRESKANDFERITDLLLEHGGTASGSDIKALASRIKELEGKLESKYPNERERASGDLVVMRRASSKILGEAEKLSGKVTAEEKFEAPVSRTLDAKKVFEISEDKVSKAGGRSVLVDVLNRTGSYGLVFDTSLSGFAVYESLGKALGSLSVEKLKEMQSIAHELDEERVEAFFKRLEQDLS